MGYSDDLQNPLWQKRRLEILNCANWTCAECGDKSKQLTVHHTHYVKDWHLWEYPNELLICLCKPCHFARQDVEESMKLEMMKRLQKVPLPRLYKVFSHVMDQALKEAAV